jgi:hypothetical protein
VSILLFIVQRDLNNLQTYPVKNLKSLHNLFTFLGLELAKIDEKNENPRFEFENFKLVRKGRFQAFFR